MEIGDWKSVIRKKPPNELNIKFPMSFFYPSSVFASAMARSMPLALLTVSMYS
jgi:hypothetical protein